MWKSAQWKLHLTYGCKLIYLCTFHIHCPLQVKFSISDLRIMLINISEFCEVKKWRPCFPYRNVWSFICASVDIYSVSLCHPHRPHLHSWLGQGVTFCKCVCACRGNCQYGKVTTAVCFKTPCCFQYYHMKWLYQEYFWLGPSILSDGCR